jgi:hypothetical protein
MRYFLFFCCAGMALALPAQSYFSTWYNFGDNYSHSGLAITTDDENTVFINTGFFCQRPEEEIDFFFCVATLRANMAGELMAVDTFEGYYTIGRNDSFFWQDSLLYSIASFQNQSNLDSQMLVRAMTSDFTVIHHNNLDSGSPDEEIGYFAPYGEGFVAVGAKGYQTCDGCDTTRVIFLDRELQIINEFSVHQEGPEPDMFGIHSLVLPDGTIIGTDIGCGLAALCGAVTRFDTTGQILWQNYLDSSAEHSEFFVPKLAALPDGNFMVSWIDNHDPFPSSTGGVMTFLGMNPAGDTLWILQFADDDYQSITVFDVQALANGDVLGIGSKRIIASQQPEERHIFRSCGYVCRISPQGELLWERVICDDTGIGTGQSSQFYDMVETTNGDLLITGNILTPGSDDTTRTTGAIWLVRTDSLGCITPGCGEYDILNSTHAARALPEAGLLEVWPNPARTFLELALEPTIVNGDYRWRVYDATGRLYYSTPLVRGQQQSVEVAKWPPGLYSWQLLRDGILVQTGRQVKM